MILAGDIGGTKTQVALCDEKGRVIREDVHLADENPSLEAILDKFLRGRDIEGLTGACFGVAGPVDPSSGGGRAKITNLPWTIDAKQLSNKLGGIPVALLNDLQATALGALVLPPESFAVLQEPTTVSKDGPIAVIAPGTGLGEALLVCERGHYRALPSEGGHADFAPTTEEEIDLLRYLRKLYQGHVSYERVLSGDGIGDLYNFVRLITGSKEPTWLAAQIAAGDRNAVVSKAALENSDPACVRALELFVEILGAEAGNLALRAYATGGVIIGGGIPPKILPALQTGAMLSRFHDKGRFAGFMRSISLRVTLEPRAALLGAAHHAATLNS